MLFSTAGRGHVVGPSAKVKPHMSPALHRHIKSGQQPALFSGSIRSSVIASAKRRTKTLTTFDSEDGKPDPSQKAALLRTIIDKVNSRFGKGTLLFFGDKSGEEVVTSPSGCLPLDAALGGGYPKGKIIEIFGPESSGKTTLALHAIAESQKRGGVACFVDAEHAFDKAYAKRLGVDVASLTISQPDTGEMALEIVDELCRSHAVDVIVVDSVSALVPRAELEGEIGQTQVGGQARLMSSGLRKLCASASKSGTTLIFINQLRHKIGVMFGNPETTSGGNALKFYASVRVDVRRKEQIKGDGDGVTGFKTKVKVVKNKCAPPYREALFDIIFSIGIDALGGLIDTAEAVGVIQRRGAWYYRGSDKLAQGREKTLAAVREKPGEEVTVSHSILHAQIEAETNAALRTAPEALLSAGEGEGDEDGGDEGDEELLDEDFGVGDAAVA